MGILVRRTWSVKEWNFKRLWIKIKKAATNCLKNNIKK